jgi:hypothetical protein
MAVFVQLADETSGVKRDETREKLANLLASLNNILFEK